MMITLIIVAAEGYNSYDQNVLDALLDTKVSANISFVAGGMPM